MAESSLSIEYVEIASRIARQLGWDPLAANRTADQVTQLDQVIQSGYRQFLDPSQVPGMTPHEWSFLRPRGTLTTAASDYDLDLPADFGYLDGDLTFAVTDYQSGPVQIIGEGQIRAMRESNASTGKPLYAAVRLKNTTTTLSAGQRFEIIFFPTPNAVYTLTYPYNACVDKLSTSLPYPLGGQKHSETILAMCQWRAEKEINDQVNGPYAQEALRLLQASINTDRRNEREFYGYNADRSDRMSSFSKYDVRPQTATYNGVSYP